MSRTMLSWSVLWFRVVIAILFLASPAVIEIVLAAVAQGSTAADVQ
jgi:hypothetical protein